MDIKRFFKLVGLKLLFVCFSILCFQVQANDSITQVLDEYKNTELEGVSTKDYQNLSYQASIFLAKAKAQELECLRQTSLLETFDRYKCIVSSTPISESTCEDIEFRMKDLGMNTSGHIYIPVACF